MPALNLSVTDINFVIVFLEGILSFFSPCVIPLIPVYISYLAANSKTAADDGTVIYICKKVFFHTLLFVLGISSAFFLLGMSASALSIFIKSKQLLFVRLGGLFIIFLGLAQIGLLKPGFLQKEHRFHLNIGRHNISPAMAYVLGFTFSFAWTPCIGPALASVLILSAGSSSRFSGNLLILVYTLGFVIPFLLLGLFTTQVLSFLKKHQKALQYTVKASGLLLMIIGFLTFTGRMNVVSKYFSSFTSDQQKQFPTPIAAGRDTDENDETDSSNDNADTDSNENSEADDTPSSDASSQKKKYPAYNFTLTDQYGNEHSLSDYKGKVVFLNFWATWCPPCITELPDIEALYIEYGKNNNDVIILGITNPVSDEYPNNADITRNKIIDFIKENEYTFPVLFDETGEVLSKYYVSAFPTTFLIDTDGNIYGYAHGMLSKNMMIKAIEQTQKFSVPD